MRPKTLADAMAKQPLPRNARVLAKKEKIHPALKQAQDVYARRFSRKK